MIFPIELRLLIKFLEKYSKENYMVFKEINRILCQNGWYNIRTKGSHFQYVHNDFSFCITVPNHGKLKNSPLLDLRGSSKGDICNIRRRGTANYSSCNS